MKYKLLFGLIIILLLISGVQAISESCAPSGEYIICTWTGAGTTTFTPVGSGTIYAQYLVVGGGGSGGTDDDGYAAGGGGGGGVQYGSGFAISSPVIVTVGAGGTPGASGGNSVISSITAYGGGKGGHNQGTSAISNGSSGGSGGGGGIWTDLAPYWYGGSGGIGSQGYNGGSGRVTTYPSYLNMSGGGGGGASQVGYNAVLDMGGNGGNGYTSTISGSSVVYGGGGGGACNIPGGGGGGQSSGGTGGGGVGGIIGGAVSDGSGTNGLGGGGGAYKLYGNGGGPGGSGIVIIKYIPARLANSDIFTQESRNTWSSINYAGNTSILGNILRMSVPEAGDWIGVSTTNPALYHQTVSSTGFSTYYNGVSNVGNVLSLATADSASYSIEGRSTIADIYDLAGTRKGTYSTGGTVNSVDIAQTSGLWAVSGGADSKVYIYSKDSTSAWYVFYNGDVPSPVNAINSTSMSWNGYYVLVGRTNNTLEYYTTQGGVLIPASNFTASVFVNKGGVSYSNKLVTITYGASPTAATIAYTSGMTDGYGKFTFLATEKTYYKINVNSNEYIFDYQATASYPTITLNVPVALVTRPYAYSSVYDDTTNIITTKYDDVNSAIVKINITDMTNNTLVKSISYNSITTAIDLYTANGTHEYRVNIEFTRTTGAVYKDTIYVKSSLFNKVTHTPDQWKLFEYGVYFIFLMFVSLAVGMSSNKYGVVVLPALVVLGVGIGFLPISIWLVPLGLSIFIAMTAVMRRDNNG